MAKNSCQKKPNFLEILGTKVAQFSCYTKLIEIKDVLLSWYSPTIFFFFRKIRMILTLKIDFENQILAFFDVYFWPFNKSHEKINAIFVISATMASIWNVFIKFHWHDEKLTRLGQYLKKPGYNRVKKSRLYWTHKCSNTTYFHAKI